VLVSREEAAVGSELTGYRVARLYADEGDWVRAGQPLAQLDDTLLRAQVEQQAAVTAQSQAEAARVAGLDGQGVLSQEQIETRRYQAKAQEAALKELRTRASRMTITSPVSGRVLQRGVQPGQIAGGGTTPWFTIARDGLVELDAEVNEADLAGVREGQSAQVSLPGGQLVSGVVRLVSPRVDSRQPPGQGARAPARAPRPASRRLWPRHLRRLGRAGDRHSGIGHPLRGRWPVGDDRRQQQSRPSGRHQGRPEGRRLGSAGARPAGRHPHRPGRRGLRGRRRHRACGRRSAGRSLMASEQKMGEPKSGELMISAWAIKNPIPVAVLFIALMIAGIGCYLTLPIKQFPNVEFPAVTVTVTQSGAAPGEMETQVTRPIEDAVAGISNVKTIRSSVVQGASTTTIEFNLGEDLQKVTDEVRSKIDQTRSLLPARSTSRSSSAWRSPAPRSSPTPSRRRT
jgi:hypothetical protein